MKGKNRRKKNGLLKRIVKTLAAILRPGVLKESKTELLKNKLIKGV